MRSVEGSPQRLLILYFHERKVRKCGMEEVFIQSEETVALLEGMGAD